MACAMWEFISVFILALVLAYPLGRYLADVMQAQPMKSDRTTNLRYFECETSRYELASIFWGFCAQ